MSEKNDREINITRRKEQERKLDAIGWGLFFIWTGVAVLADVGWGVGLIGVGLIMLGTHGARELLARGVEATARV